MASTKRQAINLLRELVVSGTPKVAAIRQAKLRLSNIKLEELTQVLRGKSKHIKH